MVGPDLRFAFRQLVRNKAFSIGAILALALGIAATTTMFGAIDSVVFGAYRGVPNVDRLVQVWDRFPDTDPGREVQVSVPNFEDYAAQQTVFERLAAFQTSSFYLDRETGPRQLRVLGASADLFPILGIEPQLGRPFTADQDRVGTPNVVLVSHRLWQEELGGSTGVVGEGIRLASWRQGAGWVTEVYEVAGVLPPDLRLPPLRLRHDFAAFEGIDLVFPLGLWSWGREDRGMWSFRVLGRLHEGVSVAHARSQLAGVAAGIAESNPTTNEGYSVVVTPLPDLVREAHGRRMTVLLAAAGLLLLIACANVAGLLMARALGRRRELAVRSALGASRGHLLRQLLTESVLLALLAGVAGVGLAFALTGVVGRFVPPDIYGLDAIRIDLRVLTVALLVSVGTSLLFGLLPGLSATRVEGSQALRQAVHGRTGGDNGGFRWLVVGQVALAFVLLSGAGLLGLSLANLVRTDPGFDPEGVVLVQARMPPAPLSKYGSGQAQVALFEEVAERIRAVPGVIDVAAVSLPPLEGREGPWDFTLADRPPPPPTERKYADGIAVTHGYFRLMGIPILEGREFMAEDMPTAGRSPGPGEPLPERPALINETMAARYWPDESALGKVFYWGLQNPETVAQGSYETGEWDRRYPRPFPLRIVGVVGTAKLLGLQDEDRLQFYTAGAGLGGRWLAIGVDGDAAATIPALTAAITGVDPELEIARVETMEQRVRDAAATARFQLFIIGTFGLLAAVLATVGLFGVVTLAARRRTREFGVRIALGAPPGSVRTLVLRQGVVLAAGGLAAGLVIFLATARLLRSMLYGVAPTDPRGLLAGGLLLAVAALVAALAPAIRAGRTDPVRVLSEE